MLQAELTPHLLAEAMGISYQHLRHMVSHTDSYFFSTRPKKTSKGKIRPIDEPRPFHKKRLRRLHRYLQREFLPHNAVHGGAKGRSCFTGARKHLGRAYIITRDVKDCFPSVTTENMARTLRRLNFRSDTAYFLSRLFTIRNRIPQGSPISTDALNAYLYLLDVALSDAAQGLGVKYHRTYDDLVASATSRAAAYKIGTAMEASILSSNLSVNERKRDENGLQAKDSEQKVHNLIVSDQRGITISKEQQQKAINLTEQLVRGAKCVTCESLEPLARKRQKVIGHMHHLRQAEFSCASHINRLIRAADRHVEKRLLAVGLVPYRKKWWAIHAKSYNEPLRLSGLWRKKVAA